MHHHFLTPVNIDARPILTPIYTLLLLDPRHYGCLFYINPDILTGVFRRLLIFISTAYISTSTHRGFPVAVTIYA